MYSFTLPSTSALDEVGGQCHTSETLPPGKTRYPLYRTLGGPQGRSGRVRKISPPTGIRSPYCPALSELLYRLSYRGPLPNIIRAIKFKKDMGVACDPYEEQGECVESFGGEN